MNGPDIVFSTPPVAGAVERANAMAAGAEPRGYVCFCEANLLAAAARDPKLVEVLNAAKLTLADGIAVLQYARLRGQRLPGRITGPGFMRAFCEQGVSRGIRHFLLGGAPGVADRLAVRLREDYPGIEVVGVYSPPFRELAAEEDDAVCHMLDASGANVLWVALGGPRQEFWMHAHRDRVAVPLMLGVGAAFDFLSGERPWAPEWVRKVGMEWAFRALTGGRRTLFRNARCVPIVAWLLAHEFVRARRKNWSNGVVE